MCPGIPISPPSHSFCVFNPPETSDLKLRYRWILNVKALIQSILRPFGLRLSRLRNERGPDYGASVLFSTLKRFGFSPHLVFDIGANHGHWTRAALKYFPEAQYVLIEPQDHLKACVQDLIDSGHKIRWVNAGVADRCGMLPFYVAGRDDSSTFLPPDNKSQTALASDFMVPVETLDAILSKYDLPVPDMVKIDAEGFDLKIMQGASRLVGKTDVFLLEAGVLAPLENSMARVVSTMADFGYRLVDITELNRSPKYGVLWLTELAFLRSSSSLLASVTSYE
jgi:FkbM family methyltransferase